MRMMGIVDCKRIEQARCKIGGRIKIATFEKTPGQNAKPQFDLVEPGAVCRSKVQDMLMGWIAQESTPLPPAGEVVRDTGHVAPLGNQTTDLEAPVGIEMIHYPVVALHSRELLDNMSQMCGKVLTGPGLTQIPDHLPCGDHQ
jgi:hypothetical protein